MARSFFQAGIELEKGFSRKFQAQVNKEIQKRIKLSINLITESIETALQTLVKLRLQEAPEVQSLAGGVLRAQFGLIDGASRISNIIDKWADSIEVTYVQRFGAFGGIAIRFSDEDYGIALSMNEAEFVTENGSVLPWLQWLLIEGQNPIVNNYYFRSSSKGRTGGGIMVERQSAAWSVPKQFSGTFNDNFATRALGNIQDEIDVIVRREITKVI
jgi:hypothetical protein